ncbi:MAG: 3-phosphoserine/phosphohydroxythreonine aminotransferase [Planctomycetaceae bacterium]|nr:3-phosphoserine/phosphohydroxythreonine aminotransferase [Planctomycetaceae bacterium]MCH2596787.1 3-phosphoserine/phosphohydroxythreonine transaminase [Pirellulales bacterium]HCK40881.1 3-phosphoserine/phosphohydroxythreonine transaminase [Planctomycetaceae bacterium]
MSQRAFNFSAGPAVLPERVLQQAQRDLLALPEAQASVMEISHRSAVFKEILTAAEANLRNLLSIPDNYSVLFLQGGSRLQFSMVPMNLLTQELPSADYILTGSWGRNAYQEAKKCGPMHVAWDGADHQYSTLPAESDLSLNAEAAYVHYTCNETIEGVQFSQEPPVNDVPLVCDASSDFLYRPLDVSRYGLIYACAQKNIGPAGVTLVVIRNDLLERSRADMPSYLNYKVHADAGSLMNTAPTFAIYMVRLVTDWLLNEVGGLEKMYTQNQQKAQLLYEAIDASEGFYQGHAQPQNRSLMNVVFRLPSDELTQAFLSEAEQLKMTALAGHRSVGGIRASIYNAMPVAGVTALGELMKDFYHKNA